MTPSRVRRASLTIATLLALAGCDCGGVGSDPDEATGAETSGGPGGAASAVPMGTVEGVVRLAEGASVPRYEPNPFIGEGARALPPECTPPSPADAEPMHLVGGRAMTSVPVIASGDPDRWPRPGTPAMHEITFHDCRPSPTVVVVTRGDRLRLVNDSDVPFFPHMVGPGGFYEALLRGEPREIEIDLAGPQAMECAMTSMCGRTEILAFHHAVHTVTGEDGHFRLEVPADQAITLTAWHPLLTDDAIVTTRVGAGETVSVEIVIRPARDAPASATDSPPSAADGTAPAAADPPDEAPF